MSARGRTVLLTGASGSIGSEVGRRLAGHGARLALAGRREPPLRKLAQEIEGAGFDRPVILLADLGQPGAAERLAEEAAAALGHVDVLVNNAGVAMQGLIWVAGDGEEARVVFETNLWSPLALVGAVAPGMLARRNGVIVNVGSIAGVSPLPRLGSYAASRAALATATRAMQLELGPCGVRIVEVVLGPIATTSPQLVETPRSKMVVKDLAGAAETIVNAVIGDAEGTVFYPRAMRWACTFPALTRRVSQVFARKPDLADNSLRFGRPGTQG